MRGFADLADLPEDDRIRIMGEYVMAGNRVAVALEDDADKIACYIEKMTSRFPGLRHTDTVPGLVADTVLVSFQPEDA